jgi:hypothetical protein
MGQASKEQRQGFKKDGDAVTKYCQGLDLADRRVGYYHRCSLGGHRAGKVSCIYWFGGHPGEGASLLCS